jgi:hypothetical protein
MGIDVIRECGGPGLVVRAYFLSPAALRRCRKR